MSKLTRPEEHLYERIAAILDEARSRVARTVNTEMVHAYWLVGREIVEVEQQGKQRAGYGDELIKRLAQRLSQRLGKGFDATTLKRMRQFYRAFPEGSRLPVELGGPEKGAAARHLSQGEGKGAAARHLSQGEGKGAAARHLSMPAATVHLFPPTLSWTHYRLLIALDKPEARAFYEIEAAARELVRRASSSGRSPRSSSSASR